MEFDCKHSCLFPSGFIIGTGITYISYKIAVTEATHAFTSSQDQA